MFNIALPAFITRKAGTVMLAAQQNSPIIFAVLGGVAGVGAIVEACKATPKFMEILEEHNEYMALQKQTIEAIESGEIQPKEEYTKQDQTQDRISRYVKTLVNAIVTYRKAIAFEIVSLTCFGISMHILNKRLIATVALLFDTRREKEHLENRVAAEYGADKLRELKQAAKSEGIIESHVDEAGEVVVDSVTYPNYSVYSKFFDASNKNWDRDPESNRRFLQQKQNWLNDRLTRQGFLFLNDVYYDLGIPRTQAGQIMGWRYYKDPAEAKKHKADNFVSFGIFDGTKERVREFMNGYEDCVLLEFNVDPDPIIGAVGLATN